MLINDIDNYIKYLRNEAGLFISLQPSPFERIINKSLMHYNIHSNPYCIYIKSEQIRWSECIKHHHKILSDDNIQPHMCMCHAGVWEYVYPVYYNDTKMTVIYVSGFCANEQESNEAVCSYCRHTGVEYNTLKSMYGKYISEKVPDTDELNTLINPLVHMLKLAYMTYPKSESTDNLYQKILYYLNLFHNEHITVEKLCSHFHYSRSTISHIFKKNSGKSINDYICDLRITEAKNLLINTDLGITAIAYALGFSDSNYFSATFKKKCGISPLKYRKEQSKK